MSTEHPMSTAPDFEAGSYVGEDRPPGVELQGPPSGLAAEVRGYLLGLGISIVLTAATFWAAGTHLIYGPGIVMAVVVLAIAQMGIHLVFFLHITTAPDNTNNVLALAFGILIAGLIVFGSLWVMAHLNHNMIPLQNLADMER
jgi:cytochrome o ubiquinol oxidase subunit IV